MERLARAGRCAPGLDATSIAPRPRRSRSISRSTLARKLAGDALAREPLAAIAERRRSPSSTCAACLTSCVRVNDALVEPVDALIQRMARERGFEGRLVILGEPDIAPGDVRLEWADGGVVRDQARIEQAVCPGASTGT